MNIKGKQGKTTPKLGQGCWANLGACWSVFELEIEELGCQA